MAARPSLTVRTRKTSPAAGSQRPAPPPRPRSRSPRSPSAPNTEPSAGPGPPTGWRPGRRRRAAPDRATVRWPVLHRTHRGRAPPGLRDLARPDRLRNPPGGRQPTLARRRHRPGHGRGGRRAAAGPQAAVGEESPTSERPIDRLASDGRRPACSAVSSESRFDVRDVVAPIGTDSRDRHSCGRGMLCPAASRGAARHEALHRPPPWSTFRLRLLRCLLEIRGETIRNTRWRDTHGPRMAAGERVSSRSR